MVILPFVIHPQSDTAKDHVQFCHNFIVILFEKGNSPGEQDIHELKIRIQILDHYLPSISNITSPMINLLLKYYQTNHQNNNHTEYKQLIYNNTSQKFSQYISKLFNIKVQKEETQDSQKMFFLSFKVMCLYWNKMTPFTCQHHNHLDMQK